MDGISLRNSHLIIDAAIANDYFNDESHVNVVYYPERRTLLMAPASDDLFKGLHKTSMVMLKLKNGKGDKSVTIQEIVIDNEIDPTDRDLAFKAEIALKVVSIYF
jgi:hypothetical protein